MTDLIISAGQTGANFLNSDLGKLTVDLALQASSFAGQPNREGPRLDEVQLLRSVEGAPIPRLFGRMRLGGQLMWAGKVREHVSVSETGRGGKGGSPPKRRDFHYTVSFAIGLCEGEISRIGRIWLDGAPYDVSNLRYKLHTGSADQLPDSLIASELGIENTPAYRGLAYIVFDDFDLTAHGNRIPQFNFEVFAKSDDSTEIVRAVNLIPGATEFGYDPKRFIQVLGRGRGRLENYHLSKTKTDWSFAIDDLQESHPECQWVSLVVTWFGTDLRAGHCRVEPRVVSHEKKTSPEVWSVAGLNRRDANAVSTHQNRPAYDGTPHDMSVIRAIRDLHARGFKVMLYPFIMMDIPEGSRLPHPLGGVQKPYPWRGRIACESSLSAAQKTTAIKSFFYGEGRDAVNPRWGLAHMIEHYADLCAKAGGVEAFLVGSELIGLSTIETSRGHYPFAGYLKKLATKVRGKLPQTKISYAADWTEYGAHYNAATNDTHFPLDVFWASPDVDFVGVDNYMPLSDWREGDTHLDAVSGWERLHDTAYLQSNIEGGEYYDWYYADATARAQQIRTPILDHLEKDFVYRRKDLNEWWRNRHFTRRNGVETVATNWQASSKPIWLTEIGCPAVDKGTNEPNKFPDFKSAEAGLPYASTGQRDDEIQRLYLKALYAYWNDASHNPVSTTYNAPMLAADRMFIWAWDARPYPAFPYATDLWVDGVSWATGHWLNGRSASTPLSTLITKLSDGKIRLNESLASLDGYVVDRILSPRQAVEPIIKAFGLVPVGRGGGIDILPRTDISSVNCSEADHVVSTKQSTPQIRRVENERLPTVLKLSYINSQGDYRPALVEARRPDAGLHVEHITLPMVLPERAAQQIAERMLADIWTAREKLTITLPPAFASLQAGDVLSYKDKHYRITRLTDFGFREIEAERLAEVLAFERVLESQDSSIELLTEIGVPEIILTELPLYNRAAPTTPVLAAYAIPWGAGMQAHHIRKSWSFALTRPTMMGKTKSVLSAGPIGRWDKANKLQIEVFGGEMESKALLDVLAGANKLAVETTRGWEILQYTQVDLISQDVYELSNLLRGQYGSEAVMEQSLAVDARVLLINDILTHLPAESIDGQGTLRLRAGPADVPENDNLWQNFELLPHQPALTPLAPAHLRGRKTDQGWRLSWIRRARIGGDDWQQADIQLDERVEKYSLTFLLNGVVKRTLTVSSAVYDYAKADFDLDRAAQNSLTVELRQIGEQERQGYPTTINLTEIDI